MNYKIDKAVPVPEREEVMPLQSLEISESIKFPLELRGTVASKASRLRKKGLWFTISKVDDTHARVWRIK